MRFSAGPDWAGSYRQLTGMCPSTTRIKLSTSTLHDNWDQSFSIAETQPALIVLIYQGCQVRVRTVVGDSAKRRAQQQTRLVGHIAPPVSMLLDQ